MEKTLHVLGLSGGKDSAALAMYMRDNYPDLDIQYYFTDTGKELPEVIDFVNRLEGYVGKIVDPYEEVFSSNREKKDFDYHLRQHKNYLPSPQARWCTIQMKLVPFEKWIQMKMEKEGYSKVVSYVGIRADEPAREGFLTNTVTSEYLTIKMPFREDGLERDDIFEILRKADLLGNEEEVVEYRKLFVDPMTGEPVEPSEEVKMALMNQLLKKRSMNQVEHSQEIQPNLTPETLLKIVEAKDQGKPGYYGWRSRSGCTFCFYQQKIEWLRLKEIYPQAFEEAKSYEKKAEEDKGDGTFYWLGKGTPLSTLETEERKIEIIENHELRVKRLEKKLNRRANLLRAKVKISDTDRMDEIYDEVEGGGACVTCYK
ncbi:phosphoadenosine phosphosulfate reductase family protein [Pseudoalteromonas sp. L21]|uniref:phosphoadenosine phosphosulfate reductase domain-containing protein n=1 Tax=Pseudoalteromonas sp. L21 TaxID=1539746 RepID=UPI001F369AFC|nr:phosphoadenosine phosphosulfate reductase family protein [Pseudoalteromonas sp. L21]MCF7519388.1 phosphoadenosine phosphosulfate reductase family protein [Pseudoalteromonas sp. L21]